MDEHRGVGHSSRAICAVESSGTGTECTSFKESQKLAIRYCGAILTKANNVTPACTRCAASPARTCTAARRRPYLNARGADIQNCCKEAGWRKAWRKEERKKSRSLQLDAFCNAIDRHRIVRATSPMRNLNLAHTKAQFGSAAHEVPARCQRDQRRSRRLRTATQRSGYSSRSVPRRASVSAALSSHLAESERESERARERWGLSQSQSE
eukprot:135088-Pleurochrysis_carterae.AAC.1